MRQALWTSVAKIASAVISIILLQRQRWSTLFPYTTLFRSQAVGEDYGLTRERVRQVATRVTSALSGRRPLDRKSTRLNSSHGSISYAVFCLKKKKHQHESVVVKRSRFSVLSRLERWCAVGP